MFLYGELASHADALWARHVRHVRGEGRLPDDRWEPRKTSAEEANVEQEG